jgi:hypothetical protein
MQNKSINKILDLHPLAHLFVLSALEHYADQVAKSKVEDYPARGLVHPPTWIELGQKIQHTLRG